MKKTLLLSILILFPSFFLGAEEVTTAIHVHSRVSKGKHDVFNITKIAERKGVDVVIFSDLFSEKYEYGLWPLQGILKKTIERSSILKYGLDEYLNEIGEANRRSSKVLLIPGASVVPYYYWKGSPWDGSLTLHNRAKDMIVFGPSNASFYKNLPVVGQKGKFNPYQKVYSEEPYQVLIDYVNDQSEGFVFWSHPSAFEREEFKMGPLKVKSNTSSYEKALLKTDAYDGFGILPVELAELSYKPNNLVSPGHVWDQVLKNYCQGKRERPAWVIGEVDYTGDAAGQAMGLDGILTILDSKDKTQEAVFEALKSGRAYLAMNQHVKPGRLSLDRFFVASGSNVGEMGDEVWASESAEIHLGISHLVPQSEPFTVQLIRNGKVYKEWNERLPFDRQIQENLRNSGASCYFYRILVFSNAGDRLLSNPIFVRKKSP